jgi:hypothetical protein
LRIVTDIISVDRCVNIQKTARKLVERLPHERWVVYLFFGLMADIAFQVFMKHTTVFSRKILKYAQISSRTVLHVEGMYFSDCKNETKNKIIW